VLLIVLTVIMAASAMEVAGGIDFLVRVAERIIRKNPKQVTIIAPLVTYGFTFAAGTGHIVYPLLPVIYEVAHENGIRPERPMAIATIASQQAITASPVSAATAAMIGLLAPHHLGLVQILIICVPSTLIAVFITSLVQLRVGKELKDDPEYQRRLASGEVESHRAAGKEASAPLKAGAMTSALIFLAGVALVVLAGIFPELRTVRGVEKPVVLSMPIAIAIVMLGIAALILTVTRAPVAEVQDMPIRHHRDHWHPWAGLARRHLHQCEPRHFHQREPRRHHRQHPGPSRSACSLHRYKWEHHRAESKLVSPNNKRKFDILVVGAGLAGASAAATLAELGYKSKGEKESRTL
jgi:anaerobic C4-dicarboxylate transporter